jgi:hypothetical protein
MPTTKAKLSTTAKGLGHRHRQDRAALMRVHTNGKACEWCGRPMYDDVNREKNWDYKPGSTNPDSGKLHADHGEKSRDECIRLGLPIPRANRLLHGACNIQRGNGGNDHLAAAGSGQRETDELAMAWPW